EILRGSTITRQPIEVVGGTREHSIQAADHHRSRTQVSFVPPPWLELTTRDPFLSATRVSPPGTMRVRSRPVSTNGRRSTWRGAPPSSTPGGRVARGAVGPAPEIAGWG